MAQAKAELTVKGKPMKGQVPFDYRQRKDSIARDVQLVALNQPWKKANRLYGKTRNTNVCK